MDERAHSTEQNIFHHTTITEEETVGSPKNPFAYHVTTKSTLATDKRPNKFLNAKELTKDELELFNMLKKNYFKTARELLQICVDQDNYLNQKDNNTTSAEDSQADKNLRVKLAKKV